MSATRRAPSSALPAARPRSPPATPTPARSREQAGGYNGYGGLGDGTTIDRHAPVDVPGLTSGVAAIAAGLRHTCALTSVGGVKCWGWNSFGQLGDGTTTDRHTPVFVSGLGSGVVAIAAGMTQSCALTSVGGAMCWGSNGIGELGDGTTTDRHTPVAVSGLASGVATVATGGLQSCALMSAGAARCWGENIVGGVGDGTTHQRDAPVRVIGFGASTVQCVVPKVLGKPLAKAKTKITRAHCRVGTVKCVASPKRKNTIVAETPRAGKRLKKGARINLEVSRGR